MKVKTVSTSMETFDRLTKLRATKQVYDGFISQLLDLWEENLRQQKKKPGSAGGNQSSEG